MDDDRSQPTGPMPRQTRAGQALLVSLGWYAGIVALYVWTASRQSTTQPESCSGFCASDRLGAILFGVLYLAPALFVLLIVSVVLTGVLAARTRIDRVFVLGSLAASPAVLLFLGWIATTRR